MYDEKSKKNLNIDWKSLLIKMAILLVIVFLVIWIVSLLSNKSKKTVESNLAVNLQSMKSAATEYFTESKLPTSINGKKKVTLGEMFDSKLLLEFKDQNDNACDTDKSYIEATKINSTDYTIKTKLVCGTESDYVISTIKVDNSTITDNTDNKNDVDNTPVDEKPIVDNNNNTSNNTNNNNSSNNTNNSSNTNKKPSNNTSTNTSNNTNNNSSNNNTVAQTCTYGTKTYNASYPLAYVIPGNCAVKKSDYYKASYANQVSTISATEYKKLNDEMTSLKNKTGATLYLDTPNYYGVYNKTNTGLVGYQIMFTMKQKVNYVEKIVYQYYLDSNGNRKVVIDKRSSISNENSNNNNNNTTIKVTSVTLNNSTLYLDVDDTYTLKATINPTNATNKKVTWTSSNSIIAKVSSTGIVTALREGTVTITATVDGKSASAVVNVYEEETYRYCSTNKERVYSTGYIDLNTLGSKKSYSYSYQVALNTKNIYFNDLEYGNITTGDGYASAYNYWKTKGNKLSLVNGSNSKGIDVGSYKKLIDHSLKAYNFTPIVNYNSRNGNTLYFDIDIRLKNLNNIQYTTPFYNTANAYGVYFVPLYFDIVSIDYSDCEYISTSKVNTYLDNGYVEVN